MILHAVVALIFTMFKSLVLLSTIVGYAYGLVSAVDSSQLVPEATYAKALSEGFTKAVIRGYEEACGVGGEVDPNFVGSYNNARAAGYTDIDTYWFPCNGSGNNCKSYATQLSELSATFNDNSMDIGTIWIDIEQDSSVCNNVRPLACLSETPSTSDKLTCLVELWSSRKSRASPRAYRCHPGCRLQLRYL